MRRIPSYVSAWRLGLAAAGMAALVATGCQIDVNGQTLPSGYYLTDDVQYFAPGPEFKLAREAAAMKAYAEQQALQEGPAPAPQGQP